jgi:hypothetical protein
LRLTGAVRSQTLLLTSILFAASLAGCAAPGPLVRLAPAGGEVTWVSGRAVLSKEQSGVRVAAAFEHQHGDLLALRLEVDNQSEAKLEIGPHDVSVVACRQQALSSCTVARRVIDPEATLASLDAQASREAAAAVNDQALYTPLLVLSVVSDVATTVSGKGNSTTGLQSVAIANQMDHDAANHASALASFGSQHQMWSNAALRRHTLQPGRAQGGLVFIPVDFGARYVWLQMRVGGVVFPFRFEQTVTQIGYAAPPRTFTRGAPGYQ